MTDVDTDTPRKLDLSPVQVMASALAAVSAAFFASWLGTAGTLIGAAVGSVVATVGAATYSYSLNRSAEAVRRRAAQVREASLLSAAVSRTGSTSRTQRLAEVEADVEQATAEAEAAQGGLLARLDPRRVQLPWGKVALSSAAVMLVALVVITSFEGLTGRSLASLLGDDSAGRTTVASVVEGGSSDRGSEQQTPSDEATQDDSTDEPTADPTPTVDPTPTADPTPTDDPTPPPSSSPSAEPTTAP